MISLNQRMISIIQWFFRLALILSCISWYSLICCSFIFSIGFATLDCDLKFSISNFIDSRYFLSYFYLNSNCSYALFNDSRFYFSIMFVFLLDPYIDDLRFYNIVISSYCMNFFYNIFRLWRKSSFAFFYVSTKMFW